MRDIEVIDFERLLGFDTVSDRLQQSVDFHDATIGARLGAKVGDPTTGPAERKLEFGKLLGFATVGDKLAEGLDFQSDALGGTLGAKVGMEVQNPARLGGDR